jgi:organic radical activating enzyme
VTGKELAEHVVPLLPDGEPIDGTALTGGEPLLQADFLAELLISMPLPRPILLETSGVLPQRLRAVLAHIDIVSMDLKIPSNTGEPEFWEAHREFLSLAAGKAYVKILIDGHTTETDLATAAELVRRTAPHVPVFLQPITDPQGRVDLDHQLLHRCYAILRAQVRDVRVLPQTHKIIGVR